MSMNPIKDDSELNFGFYDEQRYVSDTLKWHPVIDKLFWSLKLDDIKVNGVSLNICQDRVCLVTPDSGTSMSTMPNWAIESLYQHTYEDGISCAEGYDQ